ncbi:MAG TPA: hypothetical protein VMT54_00535 [Candidatus Cybelea sp.]|nr:hypothetical protein [Candidatus Cybelea sp.]
MTSHDMLHDFEKARRERIEHKAWQLWQSDGRREGCEWQYRCEAARLVDEEERRAHALGQQPRPSIAPRPIPKHQ